MVFLIHTELRCTVNHTSDLHPVLLIESGRIVAVIHNFTIITILDPVRTKILIGNKIMEQVTSFNCLGNISYEKGLNIDNKLHNYLKITGIINNVFRP